MTRDANTVREEMPVASALALSAEKRVKRLPVVSAGGQLVGIVGRTEMISHSTRNEEWRVMSGFLWLRWVAIFNERRASSLRPGASLPTSRRSPHSGLRNATVRRCTAAKNMAKSEANEVV
jgi:CBS-domain-containing membrane protein